MSKFNYGTSKLQMSHYTAQQTFQHKQFNHTLQPTAIIVLITKVMLKCLLFRASATSVYVAK